MIVETDDEATDNLLIETISSKMNFETSPEGLNRMHRISKERVGQNKPKPIIVKLSGYNVRKRVFSDKKTEKVQCKYNGKLNTKTDGNSKEATVKTRVHKRVGI